MSSPKLLITQGQELKELLHTTNKRAIVLDNELVTDRYFGSKLLYRGYYNLIQYQTRYFLYKDKPYALIVPILDTRRHYVQVALPTEPSPEYLERRIKIKIRMDYKYHIENTPQQQLKVRRFYSLNAMNTYRKR